MNNNKRDMCVTTNELRYSPLMSSSRRRALDIVCDIKFTNTCATAGLAAINDLHIHVCVCVRVYPYVAYFATRLNASNPTANKNSNNVCRPRDKVVSRLPGRVRSPTPRQPQRDHTFRAKHFTFIT